MDIRFSDKRCLTPCLLDASGATARRVQGELETANGTRHLVEAVDYDGHRCRYRLIGGGRELEPRWLIENDDHAFRSFARLVVDRLRTLERAGAPVLRRFPGGPPSRSLNRRLERVRHRCGRSTLAVLDTCITADGRLWLRGVLGVEGTGTAGARRAAADGARVEGWLSLEGAARGAGDTVEAPTARTAPPPASERSVASGEEASGCLAGGSDRTIDLDRAPCRSAPRRQVG